MALPWQVELIEEIISMILTRKQQAAIFGNDEGNR
jgi:hypothetical protein